MASYAYNQIYIQLCQTLSFEMVQETDPTNTDAMWMKYTIRVRGFLSRENLTFPGVNDLPTNQIIELIKTQLETPRRELTYNLNDINVVEQDGLDAQKGPWPLPAIVREVASGIFMVECGCVTRIVECDDFCDQELSPVLSLRWTQTESFDENWYSHLHTSGRLIVRSDMNQSADNFRPLATPGLLPDYRRISSEYTLSPDGLELQFDFKDQEFDRLPPFGFTKAQGEYTVGVEKPGFKRVGQVHLTLEGQKGTSRKALMVRAINMAYAKLYADGFFGHLAAGSGFFARTAAAVFAPPPIIWGTFRESLFECKVDITMQAMMSNISKVTFVPGQSILDRLKNGIQGILPPAVLPSVLLPPPFNLIPPALNIVENAGVLGGVGVGGVAVVPNAPAGINIVPAPLSNDGTVGTFDAQLPINTGVGNQGVGGAVNAGIFNAAINSIPAPVVMPSVGLNTYGLQNNQTGIKPPDRKRLTGLLTALFSDPCLCPAAPEPPLATEHLIRTPEPTFSTNPAMVPINPFLPTSGTTGGGVGGGNPTPSGVYYNPSIGAGGGSPGGGGSNYVVPQATINVAPLTPIVTDPLVIDTAPYDTYSLEIATVWDTGTVMMPGTGIGTDGIVASAVQSHGGIMTLITTWVAGRTGLPPQLPQFQSDDSNIVPITASIVAKDVQPSPDGGGLVYMLSGYYIHGVLDPRKYQLTPGVAPFFSKQVQQGALDAATAWGNETLTGIPISLTSTVDNAQPFLPNGVDQALPQFPPGFAPPGASSSGAGGAGGGNVFFNQPPGSEGIDTSNGPNQGNVYFAQSANP